MTAPDLLGGRYQLRGVLGRGGMAEVRDGWDTRLGRAVAVKLLYGGFTSQAGDRRRFEAEARSAAALNHPNIVVVHDTGEHQGSPYIVMERLSGRTLADLIARGPLQQSQVRAILHDVLNALAVAHDAGILHRDIKPGNILFSDSGAAKLGDFGIAKSAETGYTRTGQIVGTMAYLSPDRIAGKPATHADDVYAVGVVGYEALTGRRPFVQENLVPLARAIMEDQAPPLAGFRPDVDPSLLSAIERAMARDPQRRFVGAGDMGAALADAGGYAVPAAVRPPTRVLTAAVPALPPPSAYVPQFSSGARLSRTKMLVGLAVVLMVAALAAVLIVFDSPSQSAPDPVTTTTSIPTPVSTTTTSSPSPTATPIGPDEGNTKRKGPKGDRGNGDGDD